MKKDEKLKAGSFKGGKSEPAAKAKFGSGKRFEVLKNKLSHEKGIVDPEGLAAVIGRAAHGKKAMAKVAAKGRKK